MTDSFQQGGSLFSWTDGQPSVPSKTVPEEKPALKQNPQARVSAPPLSERGDTPALRALFAPLQSLKGLGPRGQELLTKLLDKSSGPPRVLDLLWHVPSGY